MFSPQWRRPCPQGYREGALGGHLPPSSTSERQLPVAVALPLAVLEAVLAGQLVLIQGYLVRYKLARLRASSVLPLVGLFLHFPQGAAPKGIHTGVQASLLTHMKGARLSRAPLPRHGSS